MTDYPDWQQSPATQSPNVFAAFTQTLAVGLHLGTVTPVYNWSSLNLDIAASAGACKVIVNHYADAAATKLISADSWSCNSATTLTVRVPLRGPYARIDINVTSAGSLTANTWGVFQTYPADRISFPIATQQLFVPQTSAAANTTTAWPMPARAAGLAYWTFVPTDTTGKLLCYLQTVDENAQFLAVFTNRGQPTGIDNALLAVPDALIQIVVVNTDLTTAHSYAFSLSIPPQ